ncbi:amidohydrolase [Thalassovita sp.]|uniref:amidohydrolase n=1 Tax=Thalassovita sp. TaxID=1979401 RepID=UPI002AB02DFB|nr:amidohydrolase [Thalassovita sp.]
MSLTTSPRLSEKSVTELTALRHQLHRRPEVSGAEAETAKRIAAELTRLGADRLWQGLGGHGVAAEFTAQAPGPTVLIRCELDGLPIAEVSDLPYRSELAGKSHVCGHDGHMTMVMGVGHGLAYGLAKRPAKGRVILLFQPAEETGMGAPAVIASADWAAIKPDYAFAIHNLPGMTLGRMGLCRSTAACASRGMKVTLSGKSSHAAMPDDGVSPAPSLAQLMTALPALGPGGVLDEAFRLCTLTHINLGEPAFGIAPGDGELRCTLRSVTDAGMAGLIDQATALVTSTAREHGLKAEITWHDVFAATVNGATANDIAARAAESCAIPVEMLDHPMRFSEDFGCFGLDGAEVAMVYLGSGEDQPQLHNPDFDFPDALIPVGAGFFLTIVDLLLGRREAGS